MIPSSLAGQRSLVTPDDLGLGRLFWTIGDAVVVVDLDSSEIVLWNAAAEAIFGYSLAEAIGLPIDVFIPEGDRADYQAGLAALAAGDEESAHVWRELFEVPVLRKTGEEIVVEMTLTPILDTPSKGRFLLAVIRDVTERKRAADERERLRADAERRAGQVAELNRLIAHDIRQPLATAQAHLEVLRDALTEGDRHLVQSGVEAIHRAVQRADAMIQDLSESAGLDEGTLHFPRRPVDLTTCVPELVKHLTGILDVDRVRVEAPERPIIVQADPHRLERIVENLLSNALKYSDPATPVTVRLEERAGEALVSVSDRGIGITTEDLPRLFQRGFRGPEAAAKAPGLCLGLFSTRRLVEAHGGRIWVETRPGRGSTFYVALPAPSPSRSEPRGTKR